jgi:hypothetical protein
MFRLRNRTQAKARAHIKFRHLGYVLAYSAPLVTLHTLWMETLQKLCTYIFFREVSRSLRCMAQNVHFVEELLKQNISNWLASPAGRFTLVSANDARSLLFITWIHILQIYYSVSQPFWYHGPLSQLFWYHGPLSQPFWYHGPLSQPCSCCGPPPPELWRIFLLNTTD